MSIFSSTTGFSRRSATALLAVGVLAGVAVGGGVGVIAASSTKTVTVCANNKTNILRYSKNGNCLKTETKVVLNQTGETGAAGVAGPAGPAGVGVKGDPGIGVKGDQGIAGTNGVNATLAIAQQAVCDGADADMIANEICKIGMTGPGGGLIFFVDYHDEYATYDYLEAAPSDAGSAPWATTVAKCGYLSPQTASCRDDSFYLAVGDLVDLAAVRGTHRGLFGGKAATAAIVARHDSGSVAKDLYAAGVADNYTVNGVSDWWLPSMSEIEKMSENLNHKGAGGFNFQQYWSSTQNLRDTAYIQNFNFDYNIAVEFKGLSLLVRPVRAF